MLFKTAPQHQWEEAQGEGAAEGGIQRSFTSAGTSRISCGRQSRLGARAGSPSAPGISPGVGSGPHQTDLGRAGNAETPSVHGCSLLQTRATFSSWITQLSLTSSESSQHKSHTTLCLLPPPLPSLFNYLDLAPKWNFSFWDVYQPKARENKVIIMNLHRSVILDFNHNLPLPKRTAPIVIPGCWHRHPLPTGAQTQNEPKIVQGLMWLLSVPPCLGSVLCSVPRAIPACLASLGFMQRM